MPSDVYLRLHLLSHRIVAPRSINLDGLFGLLTNVVWTNAGPCAVDGFEQTRLRLRGAGPVQVFGVDKFPRMTDYVVPSGVRIADSDRVRLGAHLAEGTTVMHEGFVNYNAGTLGTSMVEGRISAGVVIGAGSDLGGGASIMGTLSGGGKEQITVGERCLIGAEAGIGISLGDDCVVEAGCYITAGSKLTLGRRPGGQGPRAVRLGRPAVLAQQRQRRAGGPSPPGPAHRTQRRACTRTDVRRIVTAVVTAAAVVAIAAVLVVMVVVVWRVVNRTTAQDGCTFGDYSTDNAQASIAATMVGVVSTRGLPERAAVLVLAAGLQESKLRNIPAGQGDRDSIGVLQQRPSQGWGTPAELNGRPLRHRRVPRQAGQGHGPGRRGTWPRSCRRYRSPRTRAPTPSTSRRRSPWPML